MTLIKADHGKPELCDEPERAFLSLYIYTYYVLAFSIEM